MLRLTVLLLISLMTTQVLASIGKIAALRGDANFIRNNQTLAIKIGDVVERQDQIKTGANTKLQIILNDRTIVTIGKNTVFSIPEYVFGDASNSKAQFKLSKGVFKSISGKIGKLAPQRFKIKARTSTIGIRGTTYIVRVTGSETSLSTLNGATYMELSTGQTYEVPKGKELVYNIDTGKVTIQNVTTTSVSVNTESSGEDSGTKTADSGDSAESSNSSNSNNSNSGDGSDNKKSGVETNTATTETTTQNIDTTKTDTTVKVQAGKNDYVTYGYNLNQTTQAKSDPYYTPVNGVSQTTETQYNAVKNIDTSQYVVATYSGNLSAISGTQSAKGDISMKVDFTQGKVTDGSLSVLLGDNNWVTNFTGTASTSGISVTSFTDGRNTQVTGVTGKLNGKFYSSDALGMGGDYSLSGSNTSGTSVSMTGAYGVSASKTTKVSADVKTQAGSDSYTSYGYWLNQLTQEKNNPYSEALSGVSLTPNMQSILDGLQADLSYSGNLYVLSGSSSATGTINLSISGETKDVSGDMTFTINGAQWRPFFESGTIDAANSSFSSTTFYDGSESGNSYSGSINGKFYGPNAEGVGGTFDVNRNSTNAKGAYAASQSGGS